MLRPIFSTALDASLGIDSPISETPTWSCYPNPSAGEVHVVVPQQFENKLIQIINLQGQVVGQADGLIINTEALPEGIYMLNCLGTNLAPLKLVVR
jgi:hypothetical protein